MPRRPQTATSTVAETRGERRAREKAVGLLAVGYLVVLAVPSQIVLVGPLRSNGSFIRLIGLICMVLVVAAFLRVDQRRSVRPVAVLGLLYLAMQVAIWGVAFRRPMTTDAVAERDRAVLIAVAAVGILLLSSLVVRDIRQAERLCRLLLVGASISATAGLLQGLGVIGPLSDYLNTPFTTSVVTGGAITSRGDVTRVSGAAGHPIEFAVCLAMVLPLGIHLLRHAGSTSKRVGAGAACALIMLGFPFGVSRAGLLTLLVALVAYGVFMRSRDRFVLAGAVLSALGVAFVMAPRIFGTFVESITGAGEDNSISGRLDDYPIAFERISRAPWLGGAPADVTTRATVLDNQWLGTLVVAGVLGVVALAVILVGGPLLAVRCARAPGVSSEQRSLNGAIAAGVLGGAVAAFTFDLLAFQQVTLLAFLLLALTGVDRRPGTVAGDDGVGTPYPSALDGDGHLGRT